MTDQIVEKELSDETKSSRSLTSMQKFLFGAVSFGAQSWMQAESFKTNGFDQKHKEAKKAIYTGLVIYGLSITLIILFILFKTTDT